MLLTTRGSNFHRGLLLLGEKKDVETISSVGELEITPVSAAIARHLGIDLSTDGKAARNRRGIAVIVHGCPGAGRPLIAQGFLPSTQYLQHLNFYFFLFMNFIAPF